jgi:hypothetical protein
MKTALVLLPWIVYCFFSADPAEGKPFPFRPDRSDIGINFMPGTSWGSNYFSQRDFRMSYSTGLLLRLVSKKSLGITTGIQFSNICNQEKSHPYSPVNLTPVPGVYPFDSLIISTQHGTSLRFIDVPVLFNFTLRGTKTRFTLNAGFLLNYFINEKSTGKFNLSTGETITRTSVSRGENLSEIQIAPTISLGIEKDIGDEFCLKIEPTLRYQPYRRSFFSYGELFWEAGINFSFFKKFD